MGKRKSDDQEYAELMSHTVREVMGRVGLAGLRGLDPFGMIAVMHAATEEVVARVMAAYDAKMRLLPEPDDHLRQVQLQEACRDLATMANQQLMELINGWEARRAATGSGARVEPSGEPGRALSPEELRRMFQQSPGQA